MLSYLARLLTLLTADHAVTVASPKTPFDARLSVSEMNAARVLSIPLLMIGWVAVNDPPLAHAQSSDASEQELRIAGCRVSWQDDVKLSSERSGILKIVAKPGSYVRAGQVVAQLDDAVMAAQLAILEQEAANDIEIRFARKAHELALLKYERALEADRSLDGTVTEFELRELRLAAEKALLQLEQAEHQQGLAELRRQEQLHKMQALRLVAPFDGFVRASFKHVGEYVPEGEPMLHLVNTERLRIEGHVGIHQLGSIRPGVPVTVNLEFQGEPSQEQTFAGKVTLVDVTVEPVSQQVKIWAEVQNDTGVLRDGLLATMTARPQPPTSIRQ